MPRAATGCPLPPRLPCTSSRPARPANLAKPSSASYSVGWKVSCGRPAAKCATCCTGQTAGCSKRRSQEPDTAAGLAQRAGTRQLGCSWCEGLQTYRQADGKPQAPHQCLISCQCLGASKKQLSLPCGKQHPGGDSPAPCRLPPRGRAPLALQTPENLSAPPGSAPYSCNPIQRTGAGRQAAVTTAAAAKGCRGVHADEPRSQTYLGPSAPLCRRCDSLLTLC